jgi:hypothetical protein
MQLVSLISRPEPAATLKLVYAVCLVSLVLAAPAEASFKANVATSGKVGFLKSGRIGSMEASCRATVKLRYCRVSVAASRALVKTQLGQLPKVPEVQIASAQSQSAGSVPLRLGALGRKLISLQPGGVKAHLSFSAVSSSGKKIKSGRDITLRLSGRASLPASSFIDDLPQLSESGANKLTSLASSLPEKVSVLSCSGSRVRVAKPRLPQGRKATRRFKALKPAAKIKLLKAMRVAYKSRLLAAKNSALDRATLTCGKLGVDSSRLRISSRPGSGGILIRLQYTKPVSEQLPVLGIHSMIQPSMSQQEITKTMAAAKEAGVAVRFDLPINYVGQYLHVWPGLYDFSFLDLVRREASAEGVELLAIATWAPQPMTDCPDEEGYKCPPKDPVAWADILEQVAAHAPEIDFFEIWNEPNTGFFRGSEKQYVELLKASYEALKRQSPDNKVLIGGPASLGLDWLSRVLPRVKGSYDIASVHMRPVSAKADSSVARVRKAFRRFDFKGPLWITEFGYPSKASSQYDRDFPKAASSQALYYMQALPDMKAAGVERVFVTGRDAPEYGLKSPFSSEGLWSFSEGELRFKESFWRLAAAN